MNRREFLATSGIALTPISLLTAGTIHQLNGSQGTEASSVFSASKLCRANFSQCVDSTFTLHHQTLGAIDLRLVQILDRPSGAGHEQFSLFFQAPASIDITQGTYVMRQGASDYFPLYLDHAEANVHGRQYRADFNLVQA